MTRPKVNTIMRGGSRFYVQPDTGHKVPGVTSIVNMLPKAFLPRWAAKATAEYAVAHIGPVVSLTASGDAAGAVDLLKGAPWRDTRQAAALGTAAHTIFEQLGKAEAVGRQAPELQPFADHYRVFLEKFKPTIQYREETVWSEEHDYAGSFDAFAVIDDEPVWIDYKTSRSGVHAEVALQLAAYAHADYIIRSDGTKVDMPKATSGAVLHVRPEGWSLVPVRIDAEIFDVFLHLRKIFDWDREMASTVLGFPVEIPA